MVGGTRPRSAHSEHAADQLHIEKSGFSSSMDQRQVSIPIFQVESLFHESTEGQTIGWSRGMVVHVVDFNTVSIQSLNRHDPLGWT